MYIKKNLLVYILVIFAVIVLVIIKFLFLNKSGPMNLAFKSKNGTNYSIVISRIDPPYVPKYRNMNADFDLSQPTEVLDALFSTVGRNSEKYLLLLDPRLQAKTKQTDKELNGELLKDSEKDEPFPDPKQNQMTFTTWIEVSIGGNLYRIFEGTSIYNGEPSPPGTTTSIVLVKIGNHWFQTDDLVDNPFFRELGEYPSYKDIVKHCHSNH